MDGWAFLTLIFNGIGTLHYKHDLEQRTVTTVRDRRGAPQCMDQYRLMFSTTRIPCKDVDKLQFYPPQVSRHIVVICDGQFFKVPCYDKKGEMINLETLEKTLLYIVQTARTNTQIATRIGVCTALPRDDWYNVHTGKQF